jgi:hypothetical protein
MKKTYRGSCHCGAVAFEVDLDLARGTNRCNCTFCRKARFWMAIVPQTELRVLRGADTLEDYRHVPEGRTEAFLHLTFCRRCGVRPFTKGDYWSALGDEFYAVNVACLDDVSDEELANAPVSYVDGRSGSFAAIRGETRHL